MKVKNIYKIFSISVIFVALIISIIAEKIKELYNKNIYSKNL